MFMRRPRRSVLRRLRIGHDFAARPELDAQTWALGYLRAVALAAGLLGLAGVALHATSQQRRRTVASLLLSRMGGTPAVRYCATQPDRQTARICRDAADRYGSSDFMIVCCGWAPTTVVTSSPRTNNARVGMPSTL
jgi:hypothetical protein